MTHSVNGSIVAFGRIDYNRVLANNVVSETARKFGRYSAEYDPFYRLTSYAKISESGERIQPFTDMMDEPREVSEWSRLYSASGNHLYIIISLRSGSHVGFSDTDHAREIYDVTMRLKDSVQREFADGPRFRALFDNENKLFLPTDFMAEIHRSRQPGTGALCMRY